MPPISLDQVRCTLSDHIYRCLIMTSGNERLPSLSDRFGERKSDSIVLTITDASTILIPLIPFTLKSGSTTPYFAPFGDMVAVPTGCTRDSTLLLMKASRSSSDSMPAEGADSDAIYPSHVLAAKNLRAFLMTSRAATRSTGFEKNPGSIRGGSNGLLDPTDTDPPMCGSKYLSILAYEGSRLLTRGWTDNTHKDKNMFCGCRSQIHGRYDLPVGTIRTGGGILGNQIRWNPTPYEIINNCV